VRRKSTRICTPRGLGKRILASLDFLPRIVTRAPKVLKICGAQTVGDEGILGSLSRNPTGVRRIDSVH